LFSFHIERGGVEEMKANVERRRWGGRSYGELVRCLLRSAVMGLINE